MNIQRLAVVLTVVNLVLLVFLLVRVRPAVAESGIAPVLRGHALQIVDDQGRPRASISVLPPSKVDGKDYAESVLFRLIDPTGRPNVKMGTSVEGSGLLLSGNSDKIEWSGVQILAERADTLVRIKADDGREQVLNPDQTH